MLERKFLMSMCLGIVMLFGITLNAHAIFDTQSPLFPDKELSITELKTTSINNTECDEVVIARVSHCNVIKLSKIDYDAIRLDYKIGVVSKEQPAPSNINATSFESSPTTDLYTVFEVGWRSERSV